VFRGPLVRQVVRQSAHRIGWSLVSTWLVCGSVSWAGESTVVLIVVLGLCSSRPELVTILNVEPGDLPEAA
jgi:hypothetical protein